MLSDERWGVVVRRLPRLFLNLEPWVGEWLREQPRTLVNEPRFNSFIALVERFGDLMKAVGWVRASFEREADYDLTGSLFESVVALVGMSAAAQTMLPGPGDKWRAPDGVREVFLELWHERSERCRHDVTAPQVAAAYLTGSWTPPGRRRFEDRWEPAWLLLGAMTYKMVHHGQHAIANLGLPPWARQRQEDRAWFDKQMLKGTHSIVARLLTPENGPASDAGMLAKWDCEERTLWEFLGDAVLGPARAGAGRNLRPQAAAFKSSLFGRWAEEVAGTTAGTVEVFACRGCAVVHDGPDCPAERRATTIATRRRNLFVAPRGRLEVGVREMGHVQVRRKVCKNPDCGEALRRIVGWSEAEPIYQIDTDKCPYCQSRVAGQRPVTVWTRFP